MGELTICTFQEAGSFLEDRDVLVGRFHGMSRLASHFALSAFSATA
jgi:hypothetical protein